MALTLVSRTLVSLGLAGTLVAGIAGIAGAAASPSSTAAPPGAVTPGDVQSVIASVPPATDADDPNLSDVQKEIAALRADIHQDRAQIKALWPHSGKEARADARPYLKGARDVGRVADRVDAQIREVRAQLKSATGGRKLALEAELHGLRLELAALLRVKDGELDAALRALLTPVAAQGQAAPAASGTGSGA
jgi:hypothetical protein